MEPFATTKDYLARYPGEVDEDMLAARLLDSSDVMAAALDRAGIGYAEPDEKAARRYTRICCQLTRRVMPSQDPASDVPVGATSLSITGGSYSQTVSFAQPYTAPKLTAAELADLLGMGTTAAGFASPVAPPPKDEGAQDD
jgi:hypothetical protein